MLMAGGLRQVRVVLLVLRRLVWHRRQRRRGLHGRTRRMLAVRWAATRLLNGGPGRRRWRLPRLVLLLMLMLMLLLGVRWGRRTPAQLQQQR